MRHILYETAIIAGFETLHECADEKEPAMKEVDDTYITTLMGRDPQRGFKSLMDKYQEKVYWHIRRLVVGHEEARDVTQDTFVKVFRSFSSYRGNGSLGGWIYRIATNEALDHIARNKARQMETDLEGTDYFSLHADEYTDYTKADAVAMQRIISSLPEKQQVAFSLRYYDELPFKEIASIMGTTEVTARVNYSIAKSKITNIITEKE